MKYITSRKMGEKLCKGRSLIPRWFSCDRGHVGTFGMACVERGGGREGGLCAIMHLSRAHPHAARGIVNLRAGTLSSCIEIVEARAIRFFDYQRKRKETTYACTWHRHEYLRAASPSRGTRKRNGRNVDENEFRERNFRKHPIALFRRH